MPLGNGDIGLNVWIEEDGDLLFYVSKTDAWSENGRLLKLGWVRVSVTPNPFSAGKPFRQRLDLANGVIAIEAGIGAARVVLRVWVDANYPAVRVEADSESPCDVTVAFETWREGPRELEKEERHSAYGLINAPDPVVVEPDTVLADTKERIIWYHRNERSIWADTLQHQSMGEWVDQAEDPLLYRTFGGLVQGRGFVSGGDGKLTSAKASRHSFAVYALTAVTPTAAEWVERVEELAEGDIEEWQPAWQAHTAWWRAFWERSWIRVTSGNVNAREGTDRVTRGYALQRFISACAGRGDYPIKFNGSIFTVDADEKGQRFDADYRRWGGPYWFQNTRLCYWPMPASGDYEMMLPLFRMFREALPFAEARTKKYFGHEGAFYPETMYFWSAYANDNYGWERKGLDVGITQNEYIRYYWQGGLELTAMMLEYWDHTQDRAFVAETLLPVGGAVVTFFDQHWHRDASGKIRFDPAMALETYHTAVNPVPEIAGLTHVLNRLLGLPDTMTSASQRAQWKRMLTELPPLPIARDGDAQFLLPAEQYENKRNTENVPLYAVFPYRHYTVGKPDVAIGRETYARREVKRTGGWSQDPIQAALLGLTVEAKRDVVHNFSTWHKDSRFPAFWGPNFDWIPDQDHGNVAMIALQYMILQCEGRQMLLFPAWPDDWDVEFKLHAPFNTTVEGVVRSGKLERLGVTPEARRGDVKVMLGG
jgi:hypothetical protein